MTKPDEGQNQNRFIQHKPYSPTKKTRPCGCLLQQVLTQGRESTDIRMRVIAWVALISCCRLLASRSGGSLIGIALLRTILAFLLFATLSTRRTRWVTDTTNS